MPAVEELLINGFMTAAAVSRRKLCRNHKPVMVLFVLAGRRLMAIQAGHAFAGMLAQLIFMYDGILGAGMTFRTLAGGADKLSTGLFGLSFRARTVHQKGC